MLLCTVAALGSHSRGALLAIGAMATVLWWRSPGKLKYGLIIAVVGIVALAFMPETWMTRMTSISEYKADASALGRINAWWMAWNLASDRFLGGGFEIYTPEIFSLYAPDSLDLHQAHSIYFQVLGEHGFVGLFLFLLLWGMVWRQAGKLRKEGLAQPETHWISYLGSMCQVSLAGYAVGGAFLSLAYFDLPYNLLLLVVLSRRWLDRKAWIEEASAQERTLRSAPTPGTRTFSVPRFPYPPREVLRAACRFSYFISCYRNPIHSFPTSRTHRASPGHWTGSSHGSTFFLSMLRSTT